MNIDVCEHDIAGAMKASPQQAAAVLYQLYMSLVGDQPEAWARAARASIAHDRSTEEEIRSAIESLLKALAAAFEGDADA